MTEVAWTRDGERLDLGVVVITHVYPVLEVTSANIIQQRGLVQVHQGTWEKII